MLSLFILFIFLLWDQFGNIEPPKPNLVIDGEKVPYLMGSYSWTKSGQSVIADADVPPGLVKGLDYITVPSESKLSIDFDYEPSDIEVGIWENNGASFEEITNDTFTFREDKGDYVYVIRARWKEGDAIYAFKMRIR